MSRWSLVSGAPGGAPVSGPPAVSASDAERAARGSVARWSLALALGVAAPFVPLPVPRALAWALFGAAIALAPVAMATRVRAVALAHAAAGRLARSLRLRAEALVRAEDLTGAPEWRRLPQGIALAWVRGLVLPVLLALDLATTPLARGDRIRAEASPDALAEGLAAIGARVEHDGSRLVVHLAAAHDGHAPKAVRVKTRRVLFPFVADAIDVRGARDDVRRFRRALDGPLAHHALFTASAPARRWERRLNALMREAQVAATLEERSLLLEEAERLSRAMMERALAADESRMLALKEARLRALLCQRLLSEPAGMRLDGRRLAPLPTMPPDLARVVDAGGLAAMKRVVFVPFWIVPIETPWGEQEACINGATGRYDPIESRTLLEAMARRGPGLLVEAGPQPQFLPHAPPTAALLREMRANGLRIPADVATGGAPPDLVYVPFLAASEGYVSGVTGIAAPDLGAGVPVAAAR